MWPYRRNAGKYNARKTVVDGLKFDSYAEGVMYNELKLMEKAGRIRQLQTQVEFVLQEGFISEGKKVQPIKYRADFTFFDIPQNRYRVLDCKGMRTPVYQLKRKMFAYVNRNAGLTIEESI